MLEFPVFKTLNVEFENGILIVTFNRPEKLNAVNDLMKRELIVLLNKIIENDDKIGAVIFTGAGRAFTSGADINDWKAALEGEQYYSEWPSEFALKMMKVYVPVICAVNGPAVGFGFNLLLWADFVLADPEVKFIWPSFVKRGISSELGSTFLISRIVGFRKAKQIFMIGNPLTAKEALKLGIVDKLVPKDRLLDEAKRIAREIIMKNAPLAVKANKRLIVEAMSKDIEEAIKLEREIAKVTYGSEDFKEAVKAFFEKRPPVFKGR